MSRGTLATIRKDALLHNYEAVKKYAPNSLVWAVVKANAYGHGSIEVAKILAHADGFAVATLQEAEELRSSGVVRPILLLEGCPSLGQMQTAVELGCTLVLHNMQQVTWFNKLELKESVSVWLKIDSGMNRLGLEAHEASEALAQVREGKNSHKVGVMTHLACADEVASEYTKGQLQFFLNWCQTQVVDQISIANSAAIVALEDVAYNWVRPGIMLYGASPIADKSACDLGLKAVMRLTAPVLAIREVKQGEFVGYGATWVAQKDSKVATIAIGYGDGYPRAAKTGTPVYWQGKLVPLVGRVSMDMITVDATGTELKEGDQVELWGDHLSVDEVASWCDTIGYELLTRLSLRVEYHYQ